MFIAKKFKIFPLLILMSTILLCRANDLYAFSIAEEHVVGPVAVVKNGDTYIEDKVNDYTVLIPAPYWNYKTPSQLQKQHGSQPGGCVPGGGIPESLLLVLQNKDAPSTGVSIERKSQRFLLRGKDDLTDYMSKQEETLLEKMRGSGELLSSRTRTEPGGVVYTAHYEFRDPSHEQTLRVIMANILIRPPEQDVIVYQIQAFAHKEWYERLEDDFMELIDSFRYLGEAASQFFVPDAPEEKLPFALDNTQPHQPRCGEGISGIVMASAAVLVLYMLYKKKMGYH